MLEVTSTTSVGLLETVLGPLTRRDTEEGHVASLVVGSVWLGFSFDRIGGLTLLDIEPAEDVTDGAG